MTRPYRPPQLRAIRSWEGGARPTIDPPPPRPWSDYVWEALEDGEWHERSALVAQVLRAAEHEARRRFTATRARGNGGGGSQAAHSISVAIRHLATIGAVERDGAEDRQRIRLAPASVPAPGLPPDVATDALAPCADGPELDEYAEAREAEEMIRETWADRPRAVHRWRKLP